MRTLKSAASGATLSPRSVETLQNVPYVRCPLCGNNVPSSLSACPVCATSLRGLAPLKEEPAPSKVRSAHDYLRSDLPEVRLQEAKHKCPLCAVELKGSETKCPRCGSPLTSDQATMLCPDCGASVAAGATACPVCGVDFLAKLGLIVPEVEQKAPAIPPSPRPEPPARPSPEVLTAVTAGPSAAASQGLINGRGAASGAGLVKGTGMINGRGSVNGTGFVNGTGMVNGTRGDMRPALSAKRHRSFVTRWQFLAVLVVLVIVIPTFIYLSYSSGPSAIVIDGEFGDWDDIEKYGTYIPAGSTAIEIQEWAVDTEATDLFAYLRVEGSLMAAPEPSSFYFFVDSDDSPTTGYAISGIGADYMVEVDGWNGTVKATTIAAYPSTSSDHADWNAWDSVGSASADKSSRELEAMAALPIALGADAKFVAVSQDNLERKAISVAVPRAGTVLVVEQLPGPGIFANGLVGSSDSLALLSLKLTSVGGDGIVQSITPTVTGATYSGTIGPVTLQEGVPETVEVLVDTSSSAPGALVSAQALLSGISASAYSNVTLLGQPAKAYVSSAPATIVIDGAFGDWQGRTVTDIDSVGVGNPSIDIEGVGAVNETSASYFYVRVDGQMCGGSSVPFIKMVPSGGGGGIVIPTRRSGEDLLRIYIDSDPTAATGYVLSEGSKTIGADYRVEVKGLYGKIVSRSLLAYAAGQWNIVPGAVDADNDKDELEVGVPSSALGGSSSIEFIVQTTDWRGRLDVATATPSPARAFSGGPMSAFDPETWIVDGSSTSATATGWSYQRKLFYDGTNFWSFYYDGANTVYKYSSDNGQTWVAGGRAFKSNGVGESSVWYDYTNQIVYASGDTLGASSNIYVQRGTVNPGTRTIAWAASDTLLAVSAVTMGSKNSFVAKDASGYVWLLSVNCTLAAPARFDFSAFRSAAVDSIASWAFTGNMIPVDDPNMNMKGTIVPAGTSSNMWAVYSYSGNVSSRRYVSGAWQAQTAVYVLGSHPGGDTDPLCTDTGTPSAVVDSRGVIHVVYGDGYNQGGQSKPRIYYSYNSGSGWVEQRRDVVGNNIGNRYPTISLDRSTNYLYVFWVETDVPANPITIKGQRNASGVWTDLNLGAQTLDIKRHLTSIYSAPGEQYICWQWTQNTTAPIHVLFDKIPEFGDVVVPVLFVMAVFIAIRRRASSGKRA